MRMTPFSMQELSLASAELQDTALCCSQEEPQATATESSAHRITVR